MKLYESVDTDGIVRRTRLINLDRDIEEELRRAGVDFVKYREIDPDSGPIICKEAQVYTDTGTVMDLKVAKRVQVARIRHSIKSKIREIDNMIEFNFDDQKLIRKLEEYKERLLKIDLMEIKKREVNSAEDIRALWPEDLSDVNTNFIPDGLVL